MKKQNHAGIAGKWRVHPRGILPVLVLGCFLLGNFNCRKTAIPSGASPNVIILLVDALQVASLHDYGYPRDTDPFLAEFGRRGVRFRSAHTQASHTKIVVASLFTGLLPPVHGVRQAALPKEDKPETIVSDILPSRLTTVAEVLQKKGYSTAAFVANPHITTSSGFSQGFMDFHSYFWLETSVEDINSAALRWLEEGPRAPFFLYIHYMDVHDPYDPPLKYRNLYTEAKDDLKPIRRNGPWKGPLTPERIAFTRALYDAQINYWDDAFRAFVRSLEKDGWLENTLLVILADHGEEFYGHGGFGHGFTVYEDQLHIPLYVIFKGHIPQGQVRDDDAQVIDIFPTIGFFAGRELKRLNLPGRNLFPLKSRRKMPARLSYAETFEGKAPRSVQNERFKLIYNTLDKTYEFYDLANDPGEKKNIYREGNRTIRSLQAKLDQFLKLAPANLQSRARELDAKTIEELRSLGYIKQP